MVALRTASVVPADEANLRLAQLLAIHRQFPDIASRYIGTDLIGHIRLKLGVVWEPALGLWLPASSYTWPTQPAGTMRYCAPYDSAPVYWEFIFPYQPYARGQIAYGTATRYVNGMPQFTFRERVMVWDGYLFRPEGAQALMPLVEQFEHYLRWQWRLW